MPLAGQRVFMINQSRMSTWLSMLCPLVPKLSLASPEVSQILTGPGGVIG
jgi:hypothetical protein